MTNVTLRPGRLTLEILRRVWAAPSPLIVDPAARHAVDAALAAIGRVLAEHRVVYGVNTGFGSLARTRIDADRLRELQCALVRRSEERRVGKECRSRWS